GGGGPAAPGLWETRGGALAGARGAPGRPGGGTPPRQRLLPEQANGRVGERRHGETLPRPSRGQRVRSCSSRPAIARAPSAVFERSVNVMRLSGSWTLRKATPESPPTSSAARPPAGSQKPSP